MYMSHSFSHFSLNPQDNLKDMTWCHIAITSYTNVEFRQQRMSRTFLKINTIKLSNHFRFIFWQIESTNNEEGIQSDQ